MISYLDYYQTLLIKSRDYRFIYKIFFEDYLTNNDYEIIKFNITKIKFFISKTYYDFSNDMMILTIFLKYIIKMVSVVFLMHLYERHDMMKV